MSSDTHFPFHIYQKLAQLRIKISSEGLTSQILETMNHLAVEVHETFGYNNFPREVTFELLEILHLIDSESNSDRSNIEKESVGKHFIDLLSFGRTPKVGCTPLSGFGRPCIEGTRLQVFTVIENACQSVGDTAREFRIPIDAISAAAKYCSKLECVTDPTRRNYCVGCVLDRIPGQPAEQEILDFIEDEDLFRFVGNSEVTPQEVGWENARNLLNSSDLPS